MTTKPAIFRRVAAALSLFVCLAMMTGCGNGRPKCVVIGGVVTYCGKPVEGATVTFVPTKSRPASGTTDAQGHFTLQTFSAGDGVVLGEHAVCITKTVVDTTVTKKVPYPKTISLLPARYGSPLQSPLKATVTAEGPNDFKFDLTD
jgi:hypothetical protein